MKRLIIALLCLSGAAVAQVHGTIPSAGGGAGCVTISVGSKASTIGIQITGTWSGTLQPEVSIQGQSAVNVQVSPSTGGALVSTITGNGGFTAGVAGYDSFMLCGNTVGSGTVNVYLNNSTAGSSASNGGGIGNLTVNSDTFYASTNCAGLANCVTWVDDDTTDNCGASTTAWLNLINAYSGPGSAEIFIMGSKQAFLFKTCGLAFTVNHEVFNRATLDFNETTPLANCLQAGPTGLTTWHFGTTSIDWHWHGGTLKGCTNATTAGLESMAYVNHAFLDEVNFYNFGPVASGAGLCNVSGVKLDINAEAHMSGLNVMDSRALYCFSINASDCGSSGSCSPSGGSSTLHFSDSSIIDVTSSLSTNCGSVGHWEGGSHSTMDNVSIWGFDIPLRLAQTASLSVGSGGWMVHGGTYDSAGCSANGVSAAIQVGHTGSGITQGPATLVGAEFLGTTGHSQYLIALAGDSTDTVHDFTSANNTSFTGLSLPPIMHSAALINACTANCLANNNVIGAGASQLNPYASDNFVRANASTLTQGWAMPTVSSSMGINTNAATPIATSTGNIGAWYTLNSVTADQFSQASIAAYASSANDDVAVEVRQTPQSNGFSSYEYLCFNGSRILRKYANGTPTNLATVSAPCIVGDVLRLEIRGTNLTAYHNGAVDLTGSDATFTAGQPGIGIFDNSSLNTDRLTNWSGGPLFPLAGSLPTVSPTYLTTSNCAAVGTAANPSVASCVAASSGTVSCATNASTGTCTVNTTAVTVNSQIEVNQRTDTATGTRLSVTCNTTKDTNSTAPQITAVSAGTSFTFQLGTITTNPECFSYRIIN